MKYGLSLLFFTALGMSAPAQVPPTPPPASGHDQPAPRLVSAKRMMDLGKLVEGDVAHVEWRIENNGTADLVIERTQASCGCTVVRLSEDEKVVHPGSFLNLKADFDSNQRRGEQVKAITVYSNDPVEPELKLEFRALVDSLFELDPPTVLNLRALQRGASAAETIKVLPGGLGKPVEVLSVDLTDNAPLGAIVEPFTGKDGAAGRQVRFRVPDDAAVGTIRGSAVLKLRVDGIEKERSVILRGEVISDLTWQPKIIDASRQPALRGKGLAPLTVQSPTKKSFQIRGVDAGVWVKAEAAPVERALPGTEYQINLRIADDAPVGPFGTTLHVQTDSLDQPLIQVPVFGVVAPIVDVEPPHILLRQDGTPAGTHRRLKLRGDVRGKLDIQRIVCDHPAVRAVIDIEASERYAHLRFLQVSLEGKVGPGTHESVLHVFTDTVGAEEITIPVTIIAQ